jgi:mono/diheme cytochrome c family protein
LLPIYALCFITVAALGYFGGQLVYGGRTPSGEVQFRPGELVFDSNCSGCHAHGGNAILPNYPLRSAPELSTFEDFHKFIRNPRLSSGAKGPMPAFPPSKISEKQALQLYEYITHVIDKPNRQPAG